MRIDIEIDDELMANAMEATGLKTTREVVEAGLQKLLQQLQNQLRIRELRGKMDWQGDLEAMRLD